MTWKSAYTGDGTRNGVWDPEMEKGVEIGERGMLIGDGLEMAGVEDGGEDAGGGYGMLEVEE